MGWFRASMMANGVLQGLVKADAFTTSSFRAGRCGVAIPGAIMVPGIVLQPFHQRTKRYFGKMLAEYRQYLNRAIEQMGDGWRRGQRFYLSRGRGMRGRYGLWCRRKTVFQEGEGQIGIPDILGRNCFQGGSIGIAVGMPHFDLFTIGLFGVRQRGIRR